MVYVLVNVLVPPLSTTVSDIEVPVLTPTVVPAPAEPLQDGFIVVVVIPLPSPPLWMKLDCNPSSLYVLTPTTTSVSTVQVLVIPVT